MTELREIVEDFARAFKAVDATGPVGASRSRNYKPGIGPLTEAIAVKKALTYLKVQRPQVYESAGTRVYPGTRQQCDLVMPGEWALEFKLIRPFGDNGVEAEHWSENILHPYPGNISSIGDCLKLRESAFGERRGIIVFGFEHTPPKTELITAIRAFESVATTVIGIRLGQRAEAAFTGLIHPHHQQGRVFGWEVLGK